MVNEQVVRRCTFIVRIAIFYFLFVFVFFIYIDNFSFLITSEREAWSEFILIRRENPEYKRPRGHAFEITISLEPKARLTSGLLWWVGTPIPPTVYGTNTEACQYLLWHVARAAWGRGGELGVLGVREHPLVTKSTLSNLKKSFMKHFVILRSSTNIITYLSSNQGKSVIRTAKIRR